MLLTPLVLERERGHNHLLDGSTNGSSVNTSAKITCRRKTVV